MSQLLKQVAVGVFEFAPKIVLLPDGRLMAFVSDPNDPQRFVSGRFSGDNGFTWGQPDRLFPLVEQPKGIGGVVEALVDRGGEIHAFMLDAWQPDSRGEGERGGVGTYNGNRIDIWHTKTEHGRQRWQEPHCIWKGYTGALNSCLQLRGGRLLLPFSFFVPRTWHNRGEGLDAFTFMGMFKSVVLYSDDEGASWQLSNDLKVVVPDISYAYGACEPVALELAEGRVWMLIRTQMGRLYESFSPDGAKWSMPQPSRFLSSDSPAGLARLGDGRIVLCWNNCLRHPYAYGGRQVIHAALSADQGMTWRGYREVGRDPLRHEPPPPTGDHGTAYPFPVATADNALILSTGQGQGRALLVRLDPEYLEEVVQSADFAGGLEDWALFGTKGVSRAHHPQKEGARVLRLQRTDPEFPAAAVWNFPIGRKGKIRLRFMLESGHQGFNIGLTDHFSTPFDFEDLFHNVVNLRVASDGGLSCGGRIEPGRWHEVDLIWDCEKWLCRCALDSLPAGVLPLRRECDGLSYLRIRSVAEGPESGSLQVEEVRADVSMGG
ncbi:MAG: exo-alpha-sialidase [Planctomycetes bacterium]|nr:exo-alpha-sialidase [Planctomycetota bacterium]